MRQLGVPQSQVASAMTQPLQQDDAIPLAPHLVPVVLLFSSLRSQWRTVSNGKAGVVFTGLDYSVIEPTMRRLQMNLKPHEEPRLFEHLRTMEMEALRAMNERH
jgi:hypothetical protein